MSKKENLMAHIDEICEMKEKGIDNSVIADKYDVALSTLGRFFSENGLLDKYDFTDQVKQQVIDEYVNQKMSIYSIARKHHKADKFISKFLKDSGVPIQGTTIRNQIYHINQDFFEVIDSEEKAYILGFLIADGAIVGNSFSVYLQERDKKLLEDILLTMDSNHPLKFVDHSSSRKNGRPHQQDQWRFSIKNRKITQDLAKYGVVQNKSLKTYYPQNVPDELFRHLLRGIFDGDGYICKANEYQLKITGCAYLLESLQQKLETYLDVKSRLKDACGNGITKNLLITKKSDCKKVANFMYNDASIYLERKYQVYLDRYC